MAYVCEISDERKGYEQGFLKRLDESTKIYGGLINQDQFDDWKYIIDNNTFKIQLMLEDDYAKRAIERILQNHSIKYNFVLKRPIL
jgi:hypothetical protein